MKINYTINSEGFITSWLSYPYDASKPSIEVPDGYVVKLGIDKVIGGKLVTDVEAEQRQREKATIIARIFELKKLLADSDFKAIKFAEGEITAEQFAPIKAQRHEWRQEINRLEALL